MDEIAQHRLVSLEVVARTFKVPPKAVRKWIRQGMPFIPVGKKKIRFTLAAVRYWLDRL